MGFFFYLFIFYFIYPHTCIYKYLCASLWENVYVWNKKNLARLSSKRNRIRWQHPTERNFGWGKKLSQTKNTLGVLQLEMRALFINTDLGIVHVAKGVFILHSTPFGGLSGWQFATLQSFKTNIFSIFRVNYSWYWLKNKSIKEK